MSTAYLDGNGYSDITKISPQQLVDIRSIQIDTKLPIAERIQDYILKIGNPYCFACDGMVVQVDFAGTESTLEDRLAGYISQKSNNP